MCLNPVNIKINSKYVNLGYKKYYLQVPCGECSECQMMKKNEWYLRNYYEAKLAYETGGYCMFETLTYDPKFRPSIYRRIVGLQGDEDIRSLLDRVCMFSMDEIKYLQTHDYSCFDYTHIQKFLKLLRIRLERAGYNVKFNLRYFIASEYGHDDIYKDSKGHIRKGENAPHYHILFYVLNNAIPPLILAQFVAECWKYGLTDNDFLNRYDRNERYVLNNVFGPKYISDPVRLTGVHYYVCKYVCKDYEFSGEVDRRLRDILLNVYKLDYNSSEYKLKRRELNRFIGQFHRQSVGFGSFAVNFKENIDSIWSDGVIYLDDKDKVKKPFILPQYYVRHLFQRCVRDSEGALHWIWTEEGKKWKKLRIDSSVSVLSQKMQDWYNNLGVYLDSTGLNVNTFRFRIDKIMSGRSWYEYAKYIVYYRGRLCLNPSNPSLDLDFIIQESLKDPNFNMPITIDLSSYVITENSLDKFSGFDVISDMYRVSMFSYNRTKQDNYEKDCRLQKTYKQLGLKTKKKV